MPAIFEFQTHVRPQDIDAYGHANNVVYVQWMQSAAVAHSAAQGWSHEAYLQHGVGWFARRHEIEYLRPALVGEEILVRTWVSTFQKATSERRYEIRRRADDKLLARAATDWAFVDLKSGRPRRILPEVAAAFEIPPPELIARGSDET